MDNDYVKVMIDGERIIASLVVSGVLVNYEIPKNTNIMTALKEKGIELVRDSQRKDKEIYRANLASTKIETVRDFLKNLGG
jgi:hypothetical protein